MKQRNGKLSRKLRGNRKKLDYIEWGKGNSEKSRELLQS